MFIIVFCYLIKPKYKEGKQFIITIEFCLEDPKGGLRFIPTKSIQHLNESADYDEDYENYYLCTIDHNPHYWFPCVNSYNELCTWKIEVVVEESLSVITSGNLIEIEDLNVNLFDEILNEINNGNAAVKKKYKKFHYFLSIPTCAPNIGLAIGQFESHNDENNNEITFHYQSKLKDLVNDTTNGLNDMLEYFEESFSVQFPYTSYKQVFVMDILEDCLSYSSMSILNISILHSSSIIDQAIPTMKILANAISKQFFGSFLIMNNLSEWWLVNGMATFFASLYIKKLFGKNEHKFTIYQEMKEVCQFEKDQGQIILDFNYTSSGKETTSGKYSHRYHLIGSPNFFKMAEKKAHLVFRLIDDQIGRDLTLQIVKLMLTRALDEMNVEKNRNTQMFQITLDLFHKLLAKFTTRDVKNIIDLWVTKSGFARFNTTFQFNRKKNAVEVELKQDMFNHKGYRRYVGPITIIVQEIDGSFTHNVQIEENLSLTSKFEIQCHSKGKKNKKKKIPLITGEEVDIDTTHMDSDSPILWIRLDPDLKILREIKLEQPDYQWQNQARYERDICAQLDAVDILPKHSTQLTRSALIAIIENNECFYRVRIAACYALAEVANKMTNNWSGPLPLIQTFKKIFMPSQNIINYNNFSDLQHYYLQKNFPIAMGMLRNSHNLCPTDIVHFLLDLIKYNENSKNKYSDAYYRASLIDALNATVSPSIASLQNDDTFGSKSLALPQDTKQVIEEIVLRLNLEKLFPTYRYVVTSSCLKALRNLQKLGQIPQNIEIFKQYANYETSFEDVRMVSFEILIEYLSIRNDEALMDYLLKVIEFDQSFRIKQFIITSLCRTPPFRLNSDETNMNTENLVNKLWRLMKY